MYIIRNSDRIAVVRQRERMLSSISPAARKFMKRRQRIIKKLVRAVRWNYRNSDGNLNRVSATIVFEAKGASKLSENDELLKWFIDDYSRHANVLHSSFDLQFHKVNTGGENQADLLQVSVRQWVSMTPMVRMI